MKSMEAIIKELPLGVSALAEKLINNKYLTFIIIKDDFDESIFSSEAIEIHCKSALIKCNNVISGYVLIKLEDNFKAKYYPLHFNFYNNESLKLATNLSHQNKIFIILINEYNEYKKVCLRNSIKGFFKKYLIRCVNYGHKWNEDEYRISTKHIMSSFPHTSDLWDKLGSGTEMEIME